MYRFFSTNAAYSFSSLCRSLAKAGGTTLLSERTSILNNIIQESHTFGLDTVKNTVELLSGKVLRVSCF